MVGHKFHSTNELAAARSRVVAGRVLHLTKRSARDAVVRAANPRTARAVLPAMRRLVGQQAHRPPAIDTPITPFAVRFTLRAPATAVADAIGELQHTGWRLAEAATINRGLVTQRRYCFIDAAERDGAGAEYLLEVCGYVDDWVHLAIDWFPLPDAGHMPRRLIQPECDVRRVVERVRTTRAQIEQAEQAERAEPADA